MCFLVAQLYYNIYYWKEKHTYTLFSSVPPGSGSHPFLLACFFVCNHLIQSYVSTCDHVYFYLSSMTCGEFNIYFSPFRLFQLNIFHGSEGVKLYSIISRKIQSLENPTKNKLANLRFFILLVPQYGDDLMTPQILPTTLRVSRPPVWKILWHYFKNFIDPRHNTKFKSYSVIWFYGCSRRYCNYTAVSHTCMCAITAIDHGYGKMNRLKILLQAVPLGALTSCTSLYFVHPCYREILWQVSGWLFVYGCKERVLFF